MPTKLYLVAYDISDPKRLAKIRKIAYSYAFGGQKSAVECYLRNYELKKLFLELSLNMDKTRDKINIIEISQNAILLGKAKRLDFDKGIIIV